jgi:hypothetical protein
MVGMMMVLLSVVMTMKVMRVKVQEHCNQTQYGKTVRSTKIVSELLMNVLQTISVLTVLYGEMKLLCKEDQNMRG